MIAEKKEITINGVECQEQCKADSKGSLKVVDKEYRIVFLMLVSCFILWGLLNNMTDNLVPAFGKIFMMKAVDSSLVQFAFYGAYAVLAIPAALIIKKYSFRHGVLIGLGLYVIGALGYILATLFQNYNIFLVSIFILAGGLSILETTCNPYVISLGSEETSIRRINYAQAFNPLGSLMGLFIAKYMILGHLNSATYEDRIKMDPMKLETIRQGELIWVCIPYVALIAVAMVIWIFFLRSKSTIKDDGEELNFIESMKKLLKNKIYVFGVISQFFYVGMQIAVWTWMTKYVMTLKSVNEAEAVEIYIIAMVVFIGMRWICTYFMKMFMPARLMSLIAIIGIIVTLGTIYLPADNAIICLILISGCMSLMFPTIYGIALKGLGEEVKLGAAGLIMAILGGALITPYMGRTIDNGTFASLAPMYKGVEAAVRTSYYVPLICFVVILLYGIANSKKIK